MYNGRHGVGLVLTTNAPFHDSVDITRSVLNSALHSRYLLVKSTLDQYPLYIHVVYAPDEPALRGEFFRALPMSFPSDAEHIVLGDFNVTLDDNLDQRNPGHHAGVGREELRSWLLHLGLLDSWRFQHPTKREYTSPKDRNRIDFCFLSTRLLQDHLQDIQHVIGPKWQHEDHKPVEFTLGSIALPRQTKAPWRCPTWLLKDPEVVTYLRLSVESLADRIRIFNGCNPGCLLDEHKRADSKWLQERWKMLRNADTIAHKRLHQRIQDRKLQHEISPTDLNSQLVTAALMDLKAYQDAILQRNQRRKFEADLHHSERASAQFFAKPVPDAIRIPVVGVNTPNGTRSTEPATIASVHRQYWGSLFQSPSEDLSRPRPASYSPIDLATYLRYTKRRLSAIQQRALDAPLTANDFYFAIKTSKSNKAPGPDGIPAEYYQLAPTTWARVYEVVYAYQHARGRMTKFQRRAHLSLLYKSGDRCDPCNYRPLTLLNHDAKFGPKILARRLGNVLASLVDDDQSGFVPGRSIRHALLRFQDIQRYCQEHLPDAGAILLDFAKAFDSVLWPALDMVLHHFGFGDTFRNWVKTFYNGTLVQILIGGAPGQPFELGAGVRQGDPLSPALFVIFIEPMLNFLRFRLGYAGIRIGDSPPHLTLAFADDCTGLLAHLRDAPVFLEAVNMYARAAGLKLNVSKTNILPFSRHVSNTTLQLLTPLGVKVVGSRDSVKLLGILQGATITADDRFGPALQQMRQRCVLWKFRARTLQGRATILQHIILPVAWFIASVTTLSKPTQQALDVIIRNFMNNSTVSTTASAGKMTKEWIYVSKHEGGFGLTPPLVFTRATHLSALRDAMSATAISTQVPRWFQPALYSFDSALQGLGRGFDILYAAIPTTRNRTSQWTTLSEYWYSTLLTWRRLLETAGISHATTMAHVMPIWSNVWFLFGSTKRSVHQLSRHNASLINQGYVRLQDFAMVHGCYPTKETLTLAVSSYDGFERPASRTRFVNQTVSRLQMLTPSSLPRFGPHFSPQTEAAHHPWCFQLGRDTSHPFTSMANAQFVSLLRPKLMAPDIPFQQLGVDPRLDISTVWKQDYQANRHLLPVFADLKYRLQHNALGFRYKFKWHTDIHLPSTCVHGCNVDEDAQHLFWDCTIAKHQWAIFLRPLSSYMTRTLTWQDILFGVNINLTPQCVRTVGKRSFATAFNIIRGCVLRSLWLHRNTKMYSPEVSSSALFVQHHTSSYIKLHLLWLRRFAQARELRHLDDFGMRILNDLGLISATNLPAHEADDLTYLDHGLQPTGDL